MPKRQVSFDLEPGRIESVTRIVDRAEKMASELGMKFDRMSVSMDIIACHANGCPLKLESLADADDFNLAHDVFGIGRHIDRTTGKLTDCFLPRFAAPQPAKEPQ